MDISRLTPAHAAQYQGLMLEAYASAPADFTSTVSERARLPLEWWEARLSDSPNPGAIVYGAFVDSELVGVAGLRFETRERTRHKATLFGMFVEPEFRARGIGRTLVEAVLDRARSTNGVRLVQLTVTESNERARRLYEFCGFRSFGTEPFANRVGDDFVSVVHMWCPVTQDVTEPRPRTK